MTNPTTAQASPARPEDAPSSGIRLHPNRLPTRTTWWVSIDGRYLRPDFPTRAAAHTAAQAASASKETSS